MQADFAGAARIGNGHCAADMVGAGKRGMGRFHNGDGFENIRREGTDFPLRSDNVEHHEFTGRGEPTVFCMAHFQRQMHALHIVIEKLQRYADRHIGKNFASVGDMSFGYKDGAGTILAVILVEPHDFEGFFERPVEKDMVISHVEMIVLVNPRRFRPHHRGYERCEKERIDLLFGRHGD